MFLNLIINTVSLRFQMNNLITITEASVKIFRCYFQDVQGGKEDGAKGDRTPEAVGEVWPQQKRQARTRPLNHRSHG